MSASNTDAQPLPAWRRWTGLVLSVLPSLALLASGAMKLAHPAKFIEQWTQFGFSASSATPIGITEISCVLLYLVPPTRVLGAILLTGYLGGAVVTHVRVGEPFIAPLVLGIVVWAGLFARDRRVASLIPVVSRDGHSS